MAQEMVAPAASSKTQNFPAPPPPNEI